MKQEVRVELLLEVDADQSSNQIKAFVEELINTHTFHSSTYNRRVYSKIEIAKIREEGEIYATEPEEKVDPFEGFKRLPHRSKRKFRVEETTRDLVEYYETADIEISFSPEEDSNDLELIAKKIQEATDEQKSNEEEHNEYYELDSKQGIEGLKMGAYTLDSVTELEIEKEPSLVSTLAERLEALNSAEKEKEVLVIELKALTNDFPIVERQIKWHDSGASEVWNFGIGQHILGVNDEQDEKVFYWVDSEEEIEVGCDLGDFKIIGKW